LVKTADVQITDGIKRDLSYYYDLVYILAQKEIKTRYKNNIFGYVWSLVNPMAYTFVFYFAFEVIFKVKVENYVLFLISGLFAWQWVTNYVNGSTVAFFQNANLIKKARFPRFIIPLSKCLQDSFHFAMTLPVTFLFMVYYGVTPTLMTFIGIPIIIVVQFLLLFGIGMLLGSLNLFFRDIQFLIAIILQMTFYLTPIVYPISRVPEVYRSLLMLNPFAPLILSWKELFLNGVLHWEYISITLLHTILYLIIGSAVYRKLVWKFSEVM
tara:strand:- start:96411 stop:97214 length:804 start_codon:yes stop_codon:yes gene_type:complete